MGDAGAVDQDLVKRVQRGDKTAFDLLVRKYQHKVIKLVSRYVYDPSDAHDVAQEAFIKAYRALPGFPGRQCVLYVAVPDRDQHRQEPCGGQESGPGQFGFGVR